MQLIKYVYLHLYGILMLFVINRHSMINILRLYGMCFYYSLSIVMEYADGGDLDQKITDHRNRGQYFKEN